MPARNKVDFKDVYDVVELIPNGRATSYGAIARYLGAGRSARVVGWAMGASPAGIPAHRVVNSSGVLTAKLRFGQNNEMARLLMEEGVTVKNDRIQNWSQVFWNPEKELG